jgi:hypothetical protein
MKAMLASVVATVAVLSGIATAARAGDLVVEKRGVIRVIRGRERGGRDVLPGGER